VEEFANDWSKNLDRQGFKKQAREQFNGKD
jgi:hypothetical protein